MKSLQLLNLLADGSFYSGESLGEALGVSRSAVWKYIKQLEQRGLTVFAVQGKGYRLAEPLELLSEELITPYLSPVARESLEKLEIFGEIDSTNRYLLKQIYVKRQGVWVCLAEFQNAGRGRRGKSWTSPYGQGVCLSMLWTFGKGISALEGLSLAASIAVVRTLQRFGIEGLGIKWPNDIYYKDRKLAGILLEMSGESAGPSHVVTGLGLNLAMPPQMAASIDQPWTDLNTITGGAVIARNRLVSELISQLIEVYREFETRGWAGFNHEWSAYDLLAGQTVQVQTMQSVLEGDALGVDSTGALMVKTPAGVQRLMSGDVSIRRR